MRCRILSPFILIILLTALFGCGEDEKVQDLPLRYIEMDGSINDRNMFKKEIEKDNARRMRYKRDEF